MSYNLITDYCSVVLVVEYKFHCLCKLVYNVSNPIIDLSCYRVSR
jgi:hypothetical protein